ncbi:asparaginase [Paenibacillus yanchengensis]|uniref:asparaginase n=1 Tax=Paenibacillus yanchengensis TaxID=2035833 RepID=A0ABW4YP55_9BACL
MKRILVIFTGGTIGSKQQEQAIDINEQGTALLLDSYRQQPFYRTDIQLDVAQPLNILSENIDPSHWQLLAEYVQRINQAEYDGIVITHGSDTLAYTASLFSFMFADFTIPLVFTASNYPIPDKRSNGLRNLGGSFDFICSATIPGIFVVYEDNKGEQQVYLGSRIEQCTSFDDQFSSPYRLTFGQIDKGTRQFVPQIHPLNPPLSLLKPQEVPFDRHTVIAQLTNRIQYIKPYPGLDYSYYQWGEQKPLAIVHDLHHSATACASSVERYSLPKFIARCRQENILVFICPLKDKEIALYSSSVEILDAGAIPLDKITVEAAMMKLIIAGSLHEDCTWLEQFMTTKSLYFEHFHVYTDELN